MVPDETHPGDTVAALKKTIGAWAIPEASRSCLLRCNDGASLCQRGTYWTSLLIQDVSIPPTALGEWDALSPLHRSPSPLAGPSVFPLLLTSPPWYLETISTTDPLLCAVALPCSLPSNPVPSCVPCSTPNSWQSFAAINFLLPTTSPLKRGLKYHLSPKQELFSSSCPLELKVPSVRLFPCDPWLGFLLSSLWSPPP